MQKYICPSKIYKYTPLSGLKATLEHQAFKLSKPSDFNDPIDMYIQETIGQSIEEFLENLKREFHDYLLNGTKVRPINNTVFSDVLNSLHQAINRVPDNQKEQLREELINTPIEEMYDLDRLRKTRDEVLHEINTAFSRDGVFCSTIDNNNLLMWSHYADHHRGGMIEYTPNIEKDSVFLASMPIEYSENRPLPYKNAAEMVSGLEQNPEEKIRDIIHRLVYTKSMDWAYEQEYRLFIPQMIKPNQEFSTLKFHSEELTGIYFGCRMKETDMQQLNEMALKINPLVKLYRSVIASKEYKVLYKRM